MGGTRCNINCNTLVCLFHFLSVLDLGKSNMSITCDKYIDYAFKYKTIHMYIFTYSHAQAT